MMDINIWAVLVCTVAGFILGSLWYGVFFAKQWAQITGFDKKTPEQQKQLQKEAAPLYGLQFVLTLAEVFTIAQFVSGIGMAQGVRIAISMVIGLVFPILIGAVMWLGMSKPVLRTHLVIQGGYHFVSFILFGIILSIWQ